MLLYVGPLVDLEVDIGRSPLTEPEISFHRIFFPPTPNRVVFIFGMNHFQSIQNVVAALLKVVAVNIVMKATFIAQDI